MSLICCKNKNELFELNIIAMTKVLITTLLITCIFSSCKREADETPAPAGGNTSVDPVSCVSGFNRGLDLFTDAIGVVNVAGRTGAYPSCASVNISAAVSLDSDTIEIDFGSSNCLDTDGHLRRGRIVCLYNPGFLDSLHMWEIFFYDYYVDDIKLGGVVQVTNNGHDGSGNTSQSISTTATMESAGDVMVFNSTLSYVRSIGESTLTTTDDVWFIVGTANNCTSFSGTNFSANISSPVYRPEQCRYLTKGIVFIVPQSSAQIDLDYGNGACDNTATYTMNGSSYSFILN